MSDANAIKKPSTSTINRSFRIPKQVGAVVSFHREKITRAKSVNSLFSCQKSNSQ